MSADASRRALIVEPDSDGHHAFWLVLLIEAFQRAGWQVAVLGDPENPALREQMAARGLDATGVAWCRAVEPGRGGAALVRQAAERSRELAADRVFFAFLDNVWEGLLSLDAPMRAGLAGKVAGVWFHPYALDARWRWAPPLGKRWRLRGRLHRWLRSAEAGRLFAGGLYFLVDEAGPALGRVNAAIPAHRLVDPWERAPRLTREAARRALGLPEGRTVFLHLGSAEPRKGLPDVIAAFARLTRGGAAEARGAPLLLRVGSNRRLSAKERAELDRLVAGGWARLVERFVPADELMEYFAACDRVLIPYRKFRYSSGILANAIGAGRPVIASDHGYIGRTVAEQGLGLVCRHGSVVALEAALRWAAGDHEVAGWEKALAEARPARSPAAMVDALLASPSLVLSQISTGENHPKKLP